MDDCVNIDVRDVHFQEPNYVDPLQIIYKGHLKPNENVKITIRAHHLKHLYQESDIDEIFDDIAYYASLPRNPFIVPYVGAFVHKQDFYIVSAYCEGNSLHSIIPQNNYGRAEIKSIGINICQAISFLHSHNIYHHDLRPTNILVDHKGQACLDFFALYKLRDSFQRRASDMNHSTISMTPPEVFSTGNYEPRKSDVYSIGIILWMLVTKKIPRVRRFPPNEVQDEGLKELIKKAIKTDVSERLTLPELIAGLETL
eukprot:TRINITY_DN7308_c0_g1_i7.p1 TRINITY_DN7308_c0_g1~~TRINITY_DN7308_c0_g1_i7.p1  ORF type:complete len:256 (-),score=43.61 TRINITY_DN7308_c0_g1_i7:370-1137(-)